jgi:hypothetical protein
MPDGHFMAFGFQDITDMKYKELQKVRKLAGTDYALKGEISISTINKDENVRQKMIIYYSDEISDIVNIPGLPSHRTFLQGKPHSEMVTDLKLLEQFQSKGGVAARVNFGADGCLIDYVKDTQETSDK